VYYCSLIYELCLHKQACFFISTATSWNLSASLEFSLSYQAVYQYLLDNPVSRPSFVPIVIAALHSSNMRKTSLLELNGMDMSYSSTKEVIINELEECFLLLLKDL